MKLSWTRVVLCGLLMGAVFAVLEIILPLDLVGREFLAAVPSGPPTSGAILVFALLASLMGIWTMWLFAAIRPRYGPGRRTAAIAGFATWILCVLIACVWAWLGFVPPATLVVPAVAVLPVILVAALVGAWPYKE